MVANRKFLSVIWFQILIMSKETVEITPEAIEEAYKILGISKSEDPSLSKAEDDEEDEGSAEDEEEDKKEMKKKGGKKMEKSEFPEIVKAIQVLGESLNKSFSEKFEALGKINKGLSDELNQTKEELQKSQERLEELENSSSGRKSITTQNFIEKAFQENEENGKKMLSISQHKKEIHDILMEKAGYVGEVIEKSQVNTFWENEMQFHEATGSLNPRAIKELFIKDNIQLVK